jgi:hypothetical protein
VAGAPRGVPRLPQCQWRAELSEDIINADPVAARWFEDMCSSGGAGQSLLLRLLLDRDEGEATSGSKGAFGVDIKRTYMEMRPNLRYIYICATQPARASSMARPYTAIAWTWVRGR